jgi:hypothetical protein
MQKRFDTDVKDKCTSMLQISVERKDDTFEIHQRRQIEDIVEEFGEDTNMKKVDSPMKKGLNLPINTTADPKLRYRALVGALLCGSLGAHVLISYSLSLTSRDSRRMPPRFTGIDALIRVLRYRKTTVEIPFVLKLTNNTCSKDKCNVTIIADSDWARDIVDRKSFSGSCVIINGALINFITAKQPTVSTSSTEAEYISASDACREGLYFRNLLRHRVVHRHPFHQSLPGQHWSWLHRAELCQQLEDQAH